MWAWQLARDWCRAATTLRAAAWVCRGPAATSSRVATSSAELEAAELTEAGSETTIAASSVSRVVTITLSTGVIEAS